MKQGDDASLARARRNGRSRVARIGMLSLALCALLGCGGAPPPYRPNPEHGSEPHTEWRALVADTTVLAPSNDDTAPAAMFVPLWFVDVGHVYAPGGYYLGDTPVDFTDMLEEELRASRMFSEVTRPDVAALEAGLERYDLVFRGVYLYDRRTYVRSPSIGLSAPGTMIMVVLGLVGVPWGYASQTLAFEVTASLASRPHQVIWRKLVSVEGASRVLMMPLYDGGGYPDAEFYEAIPRTTAEGMLEVRRSLAAALAPGGALDRAIRGDRQQRGPVPAAPPPSGGCSDDGQCKGDRICVAGVCQSGCSGDSECKGGRICRAGRCAEGCQQDSECDGAQVCRAGRCQAGCRGDADCPGGVCAGGHCVATAPQPTETPPTEVSPPPEPTGAKP